MLGVDEWAPEAPDQSLEFLYQFFSLFYFVLFFKVTDSDQLFKHVDKIFFQLVFKRLILLIIRRKTPHSLMPIITNVIHSSWLVDLQQ